MIKLRRDRTGKVFTNTKGEPVTAAQVDMNEQDKDVAWLCEIASRHLSSKTKAMAAMLKAEPKRNCSPGVQRSARWTVSFASLMRRY